MGKMCDCCELKRYQRFFLLETDLLIVVKRERDAVHCFIVCFVRLASSTLLWKEAQTLPWESWWFRLCMKVVLQINTVSAF